MDKISTFVTFESPAFNTTDRRGYFVNDRCYGDDVADALIQELRNRGVGTDAEPTQEDFGWYFGFRSGEIDYRFVLGYRLAEGSDPAVWVGWLERKVGLLGSLFGPRERGIQSDAVRIIQSAILTLPQVTDIRWHRKENFDAGREDLGHSAPSA